MWTEIVLVIVAALIAWLLYWQIKHNPQAFTKENFAKSAYTLGILALLLIGFIAFLVMMLKG